MKEPGYGVSNHYVGDEGRRYHERTFRNRPADVFYVSNKFRNLVKVSDVVLDFGAGSGDGLMGLSCARRIGVEVNPASRRACRQRGLECHEDLASIPDSSVDIVISNHCLEHLPYPIEALRQLRAKIKSTGFMALCVPIDDWRNQRVFEPEDWNRHLHTWTVQLLGNTLVEAGFEVRPGDIRIVRRTRPGRFTDFFFDLFGEKLFRCVCAIWSVLTRRRELFAVVRVGRGSGE